MSHRDDIPAAEVTIETADAALPGDLTLPDGARGIVLFAHGSGSSRLSPRNRFVARQINAGGPGTLLFDLLTPDEHRIDQVTAEHRFDIGLLSRRLEQAVDWIGRQPQAQGLHIGLFGSSTGAAAALNAAAARPDEIAAVVSRGGRPDLADADALARVRAPTLLVVGGRDEPVIEMNRRAEAQMTAHTRIEIVAGATHLFEEPGKLEEVARLARDWFVSHL